jgi:hypothetical protein
VNTSYISYKRKDTDEYLDYRSGVKVYDVQCICIQQKKQLYALDYNKTIAYHMKPYVRVKGEHCSRKDTALEFYK